MAMTRNDLVRLSEEILGTVDNGAITNAAMMGLDDPDEVRSFLRGVLSKKDDKVRTASVTTEAATQTEGAAFVSQICVKCGGQVFNVHVGSIGSNVPYCRACRIVQP
jgi:hypothetical protein